MLFSIDLGQPVGDSLSLMLELRFELFDKRVFFCVWLNGHLQQVLKLYVLLACFKKFVFKLGNLLLQDRSLPFQLKIDDPDVVLKLLFQIANRCFRPSFQFAYLIFEVSTSFCVFLIPLANHFLEFSAPRVLKLAIDFLQLLYLFVKVINHVRLSSNHQRSFLEFGLGFLQLLELCWTALGEIRVHLVAILFGFAQTIS